MRFSLHRVSYSPQKILPVFDSIFREAVGMLSIEQPRIRLIGDGDLLVSRSKEPIGILALNEFGIEKTDAVENNSSDEHGPQGKGFNRLSIRIESGIDPLERAYDDIDLRILL